MTITIPDLVENVAKRVGMERELSNLRRRLDSIDRMAKECDARVIDEIIDVGAEIEYMASGFLRARERGDIGREAYDAIDELMKTLTRNILTEVATSLKRYCSCRIG